MSKRPVAIGVDLGTTHSSVVALDRNQAPFLLPLAPPHHNVPTAVFFPEEESADVSEVSWKQGSYEPTCLIGEEAQTRLLEEPHRGAQLFKRRMGETSWYLQVDQQQYTAESLSRLFLYQLRKHSEPHLHNLAGEVSGAVVTVPAYFPDAARRSTSKAAEAADWPLLGLLNEPTAAALAHGYQYQVPSFDLLQQENRSSTSRSPQGDSILVFDLGGGTLDLSVLIATPEQLQVVASCGDPTLGCQDWDNRMAEIVADAFAQEFQWNPLEHPETYERLRRTCQSTRERLSQQHQVQLHFHPYGCQFSQRWTQTKLASQSQPLLDRCRALLRKVLDESNIKTSQVKQVLLAGGGSRMPMIIHLLHQYFDISPDTSLDPARAVATGAALFAAQISLQATTQQRTDADRFLPGQSIKEVAPYPLGLLHLREKRLHYRPLFPKHTPLPAEITVDDLTTSHNHQTTLDLLLSQSIDVSVRPDALLAACRISDIPPMPAGQVEMSVTFTYNTRGLVEVRAVQQETQTSLTATMLSSQDMMEQIQSSVSRHIIILVDTSASMKGRPLVEAKYAISRFLTVLEEQQSSSIQKVGLVSFGANGVTLLSAPRHDYAYLRALTSQLASGGKTPMSGALTLCLSILQEMPAEEDVQERLVVLVSDGLPNEPEQAKRAAQALHDADIRIIAIGLGEDVDANFLSTQICSTQEDYRSVSDPIALPVTFTSLAMELRWHP